MRFQYVPGNLLMDLEGDKALWLPIPNEILQGFQEELKMQVCKQVTKNGKNMIRNKTPLSQRS